MDGFTSLESLYKRVKPALKSKCNDLRRIGINYVQEADVWNYLKNKKWINGTNLSLGEMVNDIMTVSNSELQIYVQNIMSTNKREADTQLDGMK